MKKQTIRSFLLLVCLALFSPGGEAQTYREQFDKLDQQLYTDAELNHSNFATTIHNSTHYLMRAYLLMYKKTGDMKYLNKFIITSKRVMDRRDDNFVNAKNSMNLPATFGNCTITAGTQQIDPNSKGWAEINDGNCVLEVHFMEVGSITYPMAQFVFFIQQNPQLWNLPLPTEALSTTQGLNTYGGSTILTIQDYSNWLKDKVYESMDWVITNHWNPFNPMPVPYPFVTNTGYFANDGQKGINQHSAMAKTLMLMFRVSVNASETKLHYRRIAADVATHLHDFITASGTLTFPANGEPYYEWCHLPGCQFPNYWEDLFHSWLDIEFAKEMMEAGVPASNGSVFDQTFMRKLANNALYIMMKNPKSITMNVNGTNILCNQACQGNINDNFWHAGALTFLTEYNPAIYHAISDLFSPNQNIGASVNPALNGGKSMLGLAELVYYQSHFNPVTVKPSAGNYNYTGGASGDFDGNGTQDLASIHTAVGSNLLRIYDINPADNSISSPCFNIFPDHMVFLAAGDIYTNSIGDEMVSIDAINNLLMTYNRQGNFLLPLKQISIPGSGFAGIGIGEFNSSYPGREMIINSWNGGNHTLLMYAYDPSLNNLVNLPLANNTINFSGVAGLTVGDFNGDGTDEIAVYSRNSGDTYLKTFGIINGNQLVNTANSAILPGQETWNGITSGDFDGNGKDEVVLHKQIPSLDTRFEIFNLSNGVVKKADEVFPFNQQNGVMCKVQLPNYAFGDAFVSFRNYDGQISVFNMSNLCQGLNLNNQTIDNTSTVNGNNNYAIDYHVNHTLVAGNGFAISSGKSVEMTAGEEIRFLPGFNSDNGSDLAAYIDAGLACNAPNFRTMAASTSGTTETYANADTFAQKPGSSIQVIPNPSSGIFQIVVSGSDPNAKPKEITVCDLLGHTVWSQASSSDPNVIDISSLANGVYFAKIVDAKGRSETKKLVKQ